MNRAPARRSLDEYVRRYPRLCALLVSFNGGLATPRCAAVFLREYQQRRANGESWTENPAPDVGDAVAYRHSFTGSRYRRALASIRGGTREAYTSAASNSPVVATGMGLVITTEGFINLDLACEFRLRYDDPSVSDVVNAVDVIFANGTSRLIQQNDPGFDQVIAALEDQGYTISTAGGDAA